jgi:hypothetical protein
VTVATAVELTLQNERRFMRVIVTGLLLLLVLQGRKTARRFFCQAQCEGTHSVAATSARCSSTALPWSVKPPRSGSSGWHKTLCRPDTQSPERLPGWTSAPSAAARLSEPQKKGVLLSIFPMPDDYR